MEYMHYLTYKFYIIFLLNNYITFSHALRITNNYQIKHIISTSINREHKNWKTKWRTDGVHLQ